MSEQNAVVYSAHAGSDWAKEDRSGAIVPRAWWDFLNLVLDKTFFFVFKYCRKTLHIRYTKIQRFH